MDPLALARITPTLERELASAAWTGLRPAVDGLEAVFDRAPDGTRPGRRIGVRIRLAPPLWLWSDDADRDGRGRDYAYRPPEGTRVESVTLPALDRRLVVALATPGGRAMRLHVELWGHGNVIVEETGERVVWCAHARATTAGRGAIAPDAPYPPPPAGGLLDPSTLEGSALDALLAGVDIDRRLLALSRAVAGLPKGALEALAPSLPHGLFDASPDAPAVAAELRAWAARAFAADADAVWALRWETPSPGALLLALDPGDRIASAGYARLGPAASWTWAARAVGIALPAPVDAAALAAVKARVRKLERTEAALVADLDRAGEADAVRARAQAMAAFLPRVPRGAARVSLPDPADPSRTLDIELDPTLRPHENVDRLFKRAGKLQRARERAPAHLAEVRTALAKARVVQGAIERGEVVVGPATSPRGARPAVATSGAKAAGPKKGAVPAALEPRRYRTTEGWEVWIGKSNQGNDHLTHRLARPEDVWMHVHGAAGSHVVLRRGKGPNEPSKATLVEVAGWAAFFSQARNAGTVPVTVTEKKFVRKPRKAPAGLAEVTRSKTVFARPTEPPDEAREIDGE